MKSRRFRTYVCFLVAASAAALMLVAGCGDKRTPTGKNLLANASFEKVVDGVPAGWRVERFKGLETDVAAEWGIDEERAYDGERSLYFQAGPTARGFFLLAQTIKVKDVRRLRVRGAMKMLDVTMNRGQFPQANIVLTCYDETGARFTSTRFYDLRTQVRTGTSGDWVLEDRVFQLPGGTARVDVACALGMEGKIWFDAVSVEVAPGLPWLTAQTKNFTFHWLPGTEYPEGSMDYQQQLFDYYCAKLDVPEPERPDVDSYLYPDSATLFETIGAKGAKKSYWDEREVHSIYPVDDHEIIHIITKPYGVLPFALTEGTAFYLIGDFDGRPVLEVAQDLLKNDKLPGLIAFLDAGVMHRIDPNIVAPAAASFVGYLIEMYGPEKFLDLHREANAAAGPADFGPAFERVYGVHPEKAEAEWIKLLARLDFSERAAPDTTSAAAAPAESGRAE